MTNQNTWRQTCHFQQKKWRICLPTVHLIYFRSMHIQRCHSQTDQPLSFIHQRDAWINSSEFPLKFRQSQMWLSYCASFVFHWMHCIRNYCCPSDIAISFVVLPHWSLIISRIYSSIGYDLRSFFIRRCSTKMHFPYHSCRDANKGDQMQISFSFSPEMLCDVHLDCNKVCSAHAHE